MNAVSLHGRVSLEFDGLPQNAEVFRECSDVVELCRAYPAQGQKPTLRCLSRRIDWPIGSLQVEAGVMAGELSIYDTQYHTVVGCTADTLISLTSSYLSMEWFMLALQISLLSAGVTMVHGAAVEVDGRALMFPAWGGIGKTSLVATLMSSPRYRLLSDDMFLYDSRGICFGFPKSMVLYPYHRNVFPQVFDSGEGPAAPLYANRWLTGLGLALKPILRRFPPLLAAARRHNPQSVRVNPSRIWGAERLAMQAVPQAIVWLEKRAEVDRPYLVRANNRLAAQVFGSTISQYDPWCLRVTNIAFGLGLLNPNNFYSRWIEILQDYVRLTDAFEIHLPKSLDAHQTADTVTRLLTEEGIIPTAS